MISANELRIGNWLKVIKPNEGFQKVNPKTIFNILYANDDAEYEPISLTPEILIAAGFIYWDDIDEYGSPDEDWILRLHHYTSNSNEENRWYKGGGIYEDEYKVYLKYVHQLQNLYFALTGTELKINL